ncbi:MAG: thiamine pyrophosphate-binding protein [Rhizobiaceae bacterium]
MTAALTGAHIIATKLKQAGCQRAFGIPGGEVLAILTGLDEAGIDFHLAKHENAAGFMAEGAWHAEAPGSRAPGILVATVGPGVSNAVNVIANAMQDRVPLIFLTGCVDKDVAETYTHQIFDHQAILRPIVKATFRASAGTVGVMMEKALAIALDGQPGPVHIDVPISVAEEISEETVSDLPDLAPAVMTAPDPAMGAAMDALQSARRPLVIAGVDAVTENAGPVLSAFCLQHDIPIITTYKGKGLLDEAHPLCLGGHGLSPKAEKSLLPFVKKADCIVLAGYDPIEMRAGWRDPWADDAKVIDITPVLRTHGMHRADISLRAAIEPTLAQLGHGLDCPPHWPGGEVEAVRQELAQAFAAAEDWGPGQVFATLNKCLPDDSVVTADAGAHRILVSQMWQCKHPHSFLQSTALCTMGCAVPLAAGYKLASPQTPVCAFVGDAGLEMGLGELATIRELKVPVIICVLVDESLALIELKQRSSQRKNVGVDFSGTDFVGVAKAMGGHGVWIDDVETLEKEAEAALQRDSYTVLACRIGRRAYDGTF